MAKTKTITKQRGTFIDKPYIAVGSDMNRKIEAAKPQNLNISVSHTGSHRTYLVKNRMIDESGNLWGLYAESNGVKYRITSDKAREMIEVYGVPFTVDWAGQDKPATLTVVHRKNKDGMSWFFKTVGDRYTKNNFNDIPALKSQSSHLRKYQKLELK